MTKIIEFGMDTFCDVTIGSDGEMLPQPRVIRNVVEEAVLADQHGIDFFGVGEHHARTLPFPLLKWCWPPSRRVPAGFGLGSAVTVLSSDDPIRVFQRFSTIDAS